MEGFTFFMNGELKSMKLLEIALSNLYGMLFRF